MVTREDTTITNSESTSHSINRGSYATAEIGQSPSKVVIATFNIRYAVGSHLISGSLLRRVGLKMARRRPFLISRNIHRTARFLSDGVGIPRVDILALQEADRNTARAGRVDVTRELARECQMHFAHASQNTPRGEEQKSKQWYLDFEEPIASDDIGDTGLAVLSRIAISSSKRVDLPWSDCVWRPRLAIEAVFRFGESALHVFNSHIDPHASTGEQLEQHREILARANTADDPTVLLGDFNTLTSESRLRMRALLETHGYTTPIPNGISTWRSGFIRLQPDWIFVKDVKVTRWGVARGLSVSDHWPVWAELAFDGPIPK